MRAAFRSVMAFIVLVTLCLAAAPVWAQQLDGGSGGGLAEGGGLSGSKAEQLLQLGLPIQQLQQLRDQAAQGGVGNAELQRLCASVAAKDLLPEQVESIGRTLGLSNDNVSRLVNCARLGSGRLNEPGSRTRVAGDLGGGAASSGHSSIERRFHELDTPYQLLAAPSLSRLAQFGYDFFSARAPASETMENVPVSPDYLIGPGDELNVLLWGRINRNLDLPVQRDGTVLVPQIGPLPVAGLSFAQTQKLIESQLDHVEGVRSDVTMGRLRTIQVFVIGQVAEPGLQTVSALAHVSDALIAAGGVRKTGSLRRIELRRDNRVIKVVDLYSMLLHGDMSDDGRLQPRDVVFVPVVGPVTGVAGDVRNPAIYELKGKETLEDVIRMAGGVSAFGYAQRIQVERVQNHERRIALDVRLGTSQARHFVVSDGDLIKVFTVLPQERNVVRLQGNVNRPGTYQWEAGMRVADLMRDGQGVRDHTFFSYALLERREGPSRVTHFLRVNLGEAISYELSAADPSLKPGDALTVYSEGEINEIPTVAVKGEVRKPGAYPLKDGMRVRDLIYEAGGLKQNAYLASAQLARTRISDGSAAYHVNEDIDLQRALEGAPGDNLTLHGGDELLVAEASNWHRPWVVRVKGEAMRPGPYVIHDGERLTSLLARCGGIRRDGYLPALILLRQSVKKMQEQNLVRASAQLQTELTRAALTPAARNQQQPNLQQKAEALAMLKGMITKSAHQQAIGRVVLDITSLNQLRGSTDNVVLEDKDEIIVPKRPSSVNVMGEVYGATAVAYNPALTVADYIDRAGGLTQDADADQIFVVKANGAIVSEGGLRDSGKNRIFPLLPLVSGGLMDTHLEAGDTIYIPARFLFVNPIERTLDVTQIVANVAQSIAYSALLGTLIP